MKIEQLITMANQIGAYFESGKDLEVAKRSIAEHLKKFWDPRMREQMLASVEAGKADGLNPLVADAIKQNQEFIKPVSKSA